MITELGHFSLVAAFFFALMQAISGFTGAARNSTSLMQLSSQSAIFQCMLLAISFLTLTNAFVTSDFSVELVVLNSHSAKPMLYKIAGTWGNHEGSMLLWVFILAFYSAMVAIFGANLPEKLKANTLAVQALISLSFIAFILFTSNPFDRLINPPIDGNDLNPLLQDPGLAFHPPFLYLGYVGLSIPFSFAIAALIEGKVDAAWARWVRPWTLLAWIFLTIGIALGSWWAYYELGWGGWWFWDPVENASFMPWLISVALLHSAIVVEKREGLKSWTILLSIMAFSFSLLGTFIVRSGVLTSVHAFANDPERGVFILVILLIATGGGFTLYAARAASLSSNSVFSVFSREAMLLVNNLLLVVATLVVFFGTVWPLLAEILFGRKLSVGAPFFEAAFTPFMIAIAMVLPIGAILPWKRGKLRHVTKPLWGVLILSLVLGSLVWSMQTGRNLIAPIGIVLAVWVAGGAIIDLAMRARITDLNPVQFLRRLFHLPASEWGKAIAHFGFAVILFGICAITAWQKEDIRAMTIGDSAQVGNYRVELIDVRSVKGPNYIAERGTFNIWQGDTELGQMQPERRFYPVANSSTTEAAIQQGFTRDVYLVIGEKQADGKWAVRTYIKPFANWIWIGAMLMALGGIFSLFDRRFRVGVAKARNSKLKENRV